MARGNGRGPVIWEYEKGCFGVLPAEHGGVRLLTERDGHGEPVVIDPGDLVEITCEMWRAAGLPVPVITPRPDIDASRPLECHGFLFSVRPGRMVRVGMGATFEDMAPSSLRQLCGVGVAFADAAEQEPDPAAVDELALVLVEGRNAMGLDEARPLARRILAAGYRREARDDG
jgi:hypothetical protein